MPIKRGDTVIIHSGHTNRPIATAVVERVSPSGRCITVQRYAHYIREISFWRSRDSDVWRKDPGSVASYLNEYFRVPKEEQPHVATHVTTAPVAEPNGAG